MNKTLFFILICTTSLLLSSCEQGSQRTVAEIGKPAPDFSLMDRQGKIWTLSELKGHVVFVHFWATWCPPCIEEIPTIQRLHTWIPEDKLKILSILNSDKPINADFFAAKNKITFPILYDQANTIAARYGLTGVPETYIIDKQGVVRQKIIGPANWAAPGPMEMLKGYINQE